MKIVWKNVSEVTEFPFYDARIRVNPQMLLRLHLWRIQDEDPEVFKTWGSSAVLLVDNCPEGEIYFGTPHKYQERARALLLSNVKKVLASLGKIGEKL